MTPAHPVDVDAFWNLGYQVVPSVYTPEEIAGLRDAVMESRSHGGDLLSNPGLRDVLLDGRLVGIASQILGSDQIVYAGDSSFTINSGQHGYHKDNADRTDKKAPDWQGRYTILRFGIYLQDHKKHTLGLNLREKSHNYLALTKGRNIYVRSGIGDVAVWSLRTSHSGNGTLLKFPWWVADPDPAQDGTYPWYYRVAKKDGDRLAVFAALGLDDAHHHRYVDYLKTRTYICRIWGKSEYDAETLAAVEKSPLIVRNVPEEIKGDPNVGQNENWQPTPY
jgi:hypothetical protein